MLKCFPGTCTDIFLEGAPSKFERGARENVIALHLDFISLHLVGTLCSRGGALITHV